MSEIQRSEVPEVSARERQLLPYREVSTAHPLPEPPRIVHDGRAPVGSAERGADVQAALLERAVAASPTLPFAVLVRLLERLLPATAQVGGRGPCYEEPVRFRHDPSLAFHASDIGEARIVHTPDGEPYAEVTTHFLGLTGSVSPLPLRFIDELARDSDDSVQCEFLDLFHHRLLGLFYRGLLKFDVVRSFQEEGTDHFSGWCLLLSGLLPEHARRVTQLPMATLLRLSPLLVAYPANAERLRVALRDTLEELFGARAGAVGVRVHEMTGGYVAIDDVQRARLGVDLRLGVNGSLGSRIAAPASELRVEMGPLAPADCARLAPGGDLSPRLCAVIALLTPETVAVTVELQPTHVPPLRLRRADGSPLGRSSWLGGRGRPEPLRFRSQN